MLAVDAVALPVPFGCKAFRPSTNMSHLSVTNHYMFPFIHDALHLSQSLSVCWVFVITRVFRMTEWLHPKHPFSLLIFTVSFFWSHRPHVLLSPHKLDISKNTLIWGWLIYVAIGYFQNPRKQRSTKTNTEVHTDEQTEVNGCQVKDLLMAISEKVSSGITH